MIWSMVMALTGFMGVNQGVVINPAPLISPGDEIKAALRDAKLLSPAVAAKTRYLTLYGVRKNEYGDWINVINFWINSLSRSGDIYKIRRVSNTLLAIVLDDYEINPLTWENLADEDPFFHAKIEVVGIAKYPGGYWGKGSERKFHPPGAFEIEGTKGLKVTVSMPGLETESSTTLITLTQSGAPILRADWWMSRVAIQADRKGTGYYDFLEIKNRDDFEKLIGLDVKLSQKLKKETAAIVARSGVANFPRQIFRFKSVTGGYWITKDVIVNNKDEKNPVRNLDQDYKHQAEEHYGILPNGLFAYFLSDDKGVKQDSAPDGIGFDKKSESNDGKIHVGLSCVRCHVEGIRPIDDWARKAFSKNLLSSPDYEKQKRLNQLYLSELNDKIEEDKLQHTSALKRLTGWKIEESSKAIHKAWKDYVDKDLMPADAAKDLGVTEEQYLAALKKEATTNKLFDPVLSSHLNDPPLPIRSDDWEQVYVLAYGILLGDKKKP